MRRGITDTAPLADKARKARQLLNTAGEPERETRSRQFNLMEALGVMALLLAVLWWVAYPLGVVMDFPSASLASRTGVAALIGYALLISPWLHGDTARSRGLGNPGQGLRTLRQGPLRRRLGMLITIGALTAVFTLELYRYATGADGLVLGIEPNLTLHLERDLGGETSVLLACLAVALVWTVCIVRYDNFGSALKGAGQILFLMLPVMLLVAWAVNGAEAFQVANPGQLVLNGLGYGFWGAAQQLVFCSYFGTRLRKGVAPPERLQARVWRRLGVASLNGLFFGLVHMNNWLLVGFAWILGSLLSWYFMEDRYRNLQVLGLTHGLLGTGVLWLFTKKGQPLTIHLLAGPWALRHHWDPVVVAVASLLIVGFGLLLRALTRRSGQQPE